jgi:hypothetical protein
MFCRPLIRPGNLRLAKSAAGYESCFSIQLAEQAGSGKWHYLVTPA